MKRLNQNRTRSGRAFSRTDLVAKAILLFGGLVLGLVFMIVTSDSTTDAPPWLHLVIVIVAAILLIGFGLKRQRPLLTALGVAVLGLGLMLFFEGDRLPPEIAVPLTILLVIAFFLVRGGILGGGNGSDGGGDAGGGGGGPDLG